MGMTSRERILAVAERCKANMQRDYVDVIEHTLACETDLCFVCGKLGDGVRGNRHPADPPPLDPTPLLVEDPPPFKRFGAEDLWPASELPAVAVVRERFGMALYEAIMVGRLDPFLTPAAQRKLIGHTQEIGALFLQTYLEVGQALSEGFPPYSDTPRRKWRAK